MASERKLTIEDHLDHLKMIWASETGGKTSFELWLTGKYLDKCEALKVARQLIKSERDILNKHQ